MSFSFTLFWQGIIAKEPPLSLQQGIQRLRGSDGCQRSESEFEMADIFYFCRRGMESIVDDEVTKRFSAQELESWNLLTRSNDHFRHISPRLTVLWGLGILIRYGVLLPLRSEWFKVHLKVLIGDDVVTLHLLFVLLLCRATLAVTGIVLLLVLTTVVGILPNREWVYYNSPHSLSTHIILEIHAQEAQH